MVDTKNKWEIKTLGEVCKIRTGKKDVNQGNSNGQYPFFTCAREHTYSDQYSFDCEAILIAGNGEVGICHYYKGKFEAYQRTYVLSDFVPEIDISFLYYFVSAKLKDEFRDKKLGNSMPYIRVGMLKSIVVPIPHLMEQKQIVKILDEKFRAIEELKRVTEQQIVDVTELFESRLNDVFENPRSNWPEVTFDDVCEITSKLIDPKDEKYQDFIHIGAGNIVAVKGELEGLKTAREEKLISGKFIFDSNMVLYSKIRPYLMKVVRPKFSGLCSADIYPLSPKENLLTRDFLFYLLFSKKFTDYAIKGSARAGMPKVNREHLFAYSFFLPNVKEQRQIANELDELSEKTKELEAIFRRKIADLEELKKSYLEQAFSGNL